MYNVYLMELQIAFKSNIVVLFWFKIDKILCHSKVIRSSNSSVFLCRNKLWIPCELDQSMNVCKISDKICNLKQWDANILLFGKLDLQVLHLKKWAPSRSSPHSSCSKVRTFSQANLMRIARHVFVLGYILSSRHFIWLWSIDPASALKNLKDWGSTNQKSHHKGIITRWHQSHMQ